MQGTTNIAIVTKNIKGAILIISVIWSYYETIRTLREYE